MLVPTEIPDDPDGPNREDPDVFGPFTTAEEARNWALSYRLTGYIVRKMITPEFVILRRREREEDAAFDARKN